MTTPANAPIRIWLEVSHHPAFRVGGWALVRQAAGEVAGTAAGERRIDAERAGLAALAAAVRDLPPGALAQIHTASPLLLAIPARLAAAQRGETPPEDNLDLWAQAATALARPGGLVLVRAQPAPGGPTAFAAAWADLARDRAKDKGPFTSAIPRPNLAKAGV